MAETPTQTAVLLIAHGSRHQPANDDLHAMAARFSAQGEHTIVEACFLELAEPDIATGGSRYAARGATRVLLVPYLYCNSSSAWFCLRRGRDSASSRGPVCSSHPSFRLGSKLGNKNRSN
ncbi:MAG: sirohydrochlorin chelatase [Isosphaeraceae bacterium]